MTVGGPALTASPRVRLTAVLTAAGIAGALLGTAIVAVRPAPGLPDPGAAIEASLPIVRVLLDLAALTTVGLCVLPLLIGDRPEPALAASRVWAAAGSLVWAACALVLLVLQTAELHPDRAVSFAAIRRYVDELGAGKALLVVIVSALACAALAVLAARTGEPLSAELRAAVALFALLPLPVTGHAMDSSWHDVTMVSMELHILGATAWAGGLFAVLALVASNRALLAEVLPRFSKLATVCLVVVAATGLANGITEVVVTRDLLSGLFGTGYGRLLIGKMLCLLGLAALGGNIRFRLLPAIVRRKPTALLRWAAAELTVMGAAFGLAAVLARAPIG
ncbi:copper resistance D family protein [Amycolatopsis sp. WGS_07]|uniref:copper resistance D family protein n=1 Tax=Amycolatopsis sp. WGS_07 TaxID=3076764 RepID=UPI0038733219